MGTHGSQATDVQVTGARTHVDLTIALPRPGSGISSLTSPGSVNGSPECVHGAWLDDHAGRGQAQPQPHAQARVGARFAGDNRFANGNVGTVTCVVTQAERPHRFAWVVLDGAEDPDRPGSIWSYELAPGGSADETRVRHTFVHGPGETGVRAAVRQHPEQAAEIAEGRLAQLRRHMIETLRGMERAPSGSSSAERSCPGKSIASLRPNSSCSTWMSRLCMLCGCQSTEAHCAKTPDAVLPTLAVVEAAGAVGVERFVNISTDKAADPPLLRPRPPHQSPPHHHHEHRTHHPKVTPHTNIQALSA
jgi:uncharacterized protein YndB with AHSA1/START domain